MLGDGLRCGELEMEVVKGFTRCRSASRTQKRLQQFSPLKQVDR